MYAGTMEHSPVKTVDEVYLERLRKEFTTLNDALVQQFKVPAVDAREEYNNRELGGSNGEGSGGEGYMGRIWSYAKKVKDALLPDEMKKRFNLRAGSNHFNRKLNMLRGGMPKRKHDGGKRKAASKEKPTKKQ